MYYYLKIPFKYRYDPVPGVHKYKNEKNENNPRKKN